MKEHWKKHTATAYFRIDYVYAGKDHANPRVKGFIALGPDFQLRTGFKTAQSAMDKADALWPVDYDEPI